MIGAFKHVNLPAHLRSAAKHAQKRVKKGEIWATTAALLNLHTFLFNKNTDMMYVIQIKEY
ncbi:hypothetical protein NBRC116583_04340 [Arenicella sp. 4NH20-0111]